MSTASRVAARALARYFVNVPASDLAVNQTVAYDFRRSFSSPKNVRDVPKISLVEFALRLCRHMFKVDTEAFPMVICGIIYVERIRAMWPNCLLVADSTRHRLMLTSLVLATKFHCDVFYGQDYYGKCGGIQKEELNAMEMVFLKLCDHRLFVSVSEFIDVASKMS